MQLFFQAVARVVFPLNEKLEMIPGNAWESQEDRNPEHRRGLLDILENFRLWQIERKNQNPPSSTLPTPEPTGLDALLPRIPEIKLDADTVKALINAAEDLTKSLVGPPPTEPDMIDYNATNISTTIPPNEFFCLFC